MLFEQATIIAEIMESPESVDIVILKLEKKILLSVELIVKSLAEYQTVQTLIRVLLKEQSDQGLHSLPQIRIFCPYLRWITVKHIREYFWHGKRFWKRLVMGKKRIWQGSVH